MGQNQKHKSTLLTSAQTLLLTLVSPMLLDFIVVVTKTQKKNNLGHCFRLPVFGSAA